ncbi:phage tail tube protein [Caulobacter soli]|uniref:phage tail tube protein n=1 Tax=Caulobacter soli TaxID=2708539 RepID=UPI0013ED2601|nr:phage tail tube protein [Caulobacter soli]
MAGKLLSELTFKANGRTWNTKKGATFNPGGTNRTTKKGARKVYGFTEEIAESKLEVEIYIDADTSVAELNAIKDATVECGLDTGQSYAVSPMWVTEPGTIDENEGTIKLTLEGPPAEEMF